MTLASVDRVGHHGYAPPGGAEMHVKVLGPIELHDGEQLVPIGTNQRLLVAMLAARPGEVVSAGALAEALWPDSPPQHPAGALQNLVSRLRARLGDVGAEALRTQPPGYGLSLDRVSLDHLEFERALAEARTTSDLATAVERYDDALVAWRGDAYSEFADVDRIRDEAIRLDELRSVAREERLALIVRLDPQRALPELESLVAVQPYRERAHMLLMEALYRNHRQHDALAAFERYRVVLAEELGLTPSEAMRRLENAILTDSMPSVTPIPDTPSSNVERPGSAGRNAGGPSVRSGNLAERRTSFVGRSAELADVAELLTERRLVSLVGAAGAGKTALATEVARATADHYSDGAWIVDLVGLPPDGRIADHIAGSLGLGRLPADESVLALARELASLDALVVLDNCEHLLNQVAAVVDTVLAVRGGVRFLATSRESLRIPGELVHPVPPLMLPPAGADRERLLASASGRLFVERVLDVDPALVLEEPDAPVIAEICRRLDGLPLAIELAASRLPTLGLRALASRLDERFSLLSSHHRTSVEHHQTLRAAIDWSVQLLDEPQRLLFARLGVFVGDFSLDAAEHVCADECLDASIVADTLSRLVDRSLVVRSRADSPIRFRLLETVREHARSLVADDEFLALRERHRQWCTADAHAVGDGFLVETTTWYARLRAIFPNYRSAFEWSMSCGDVAEALDIATALSWAPLNTGHLYREFQSWVERALALADGNDVDRGLLARGLVAAASLATLESRPTEAIELLVLASDEFEACGDCERDIIWSRMWMAAALADAGRHTEAVDVAADGLQRALASGDDAAVVYLASQHAEVAVGAALLAGHDSSRSAAAASFRLAIETADRLGAEEGLIRARHGHALFAAVEESSDTALSECHAALDEWRRIGLGNRLIMGLVATARVAVLAGELAVAARLVEEAFDAIDRVGWWQATGRALEVAALLALERGELEHAALLVGAAEARFATPRWYVPIDSPQAAAIERFGDPRGLPEQLSIGRGLTDAAVAALARRVARSFVVADQA